jgi:hypothetical protein
MRLREIWDQIGASQRLLAAVLIGFAISLLVLFIVLPLARFLGIGDVLGLTCDTQGEPR